jgi:transcriptional regulator with XRE-family HTH domain|tara:strand:+ start:49492 stop:49800 length:309 start_codon:yes stop_codon:yes gene_type:complete
MRNSTAWLGEIIFEERTKKGYSFNKLSAISGVPLSTVKNMETVDCNPSIKATMAVLNALGMDLEVLYADTPRENFNIVSKDTKSIPYAHNDARQYDHDNHAA